MEKYYILYEAPYGLTVEYIGEFSDLESAVARAQTTAPDVYLICESDLRGLLGSIQNVLTK